MDLLQRFRDDVAQSNRGRLTVISKATGVPLKNLSNLARGTVRHPRYDTTEPLRAFYAREDAERTLESRTA